jgi:GNAT superfamily N-acetyltransferase
MSSRPASSRTDAPRIRPAGRGDGPQLQAIERAASEPFRTVGLDEIAEDDPSSLDELDAYVAGARSWVAVDAADRPVGYVLVDEVDGGAHIEQVSVLPDHQGRGIGRALIDRVDAWAGAEGHTTVTLTTFTDVPWNRPLYEHLGFRVLSEDEIGPGLHAVRAAEAEHGLDPRLRVCMRRAVVQAPATRAPRIQGPGSGGE